MHGRATLAPGFLNNSGLSRRLDLMPGNRPGSYSTSYADSERERPHLRQETYFGRRTSQPNSVPTILEPIRRLVSKARLKWDAAYYQLQLGRLPVAKPWQWEQSKSLTGYDAQARSCLVLLGHLARGVSQTQQRCSSIREGFRTGPASDAGMEALDDTGEATRPHVAAGSAQCAAAPSSSHASRFDSPADCDRRTTGAREGSTRNVPLRCIPVANQSATA